jgi:hypothetical protein
VSFQRRRLVPVLAAVALSAGLTPLTGEAHAAAPAAPVAWTQSIQGGDTGEVDPNAAILTDPSGDVTFGGCTAFDPKEAIETWTSGHRLVGSRLVMASPNPLLCDGSGLTDARRITYSLLFNNASDVYDMMAFKPDGANLWSAPMPLPATCAGNPLSFGYSQPILGADGNIYGLVYYGQVNACPTALKLYGVNHKTGALLFADTLNPDGATFVSDVDAYTGGLVVRSDNQVTYYNYGGQVIGGPYALAGQQIDRDESVAATTSGRAFVATAKTTTATSSCPLQFTLDGIEAFQPTGFLWKTAIRGCNQTPSINAMPDGGVMVVEESFAPGNVGATSILRYSSTGRLLWEKPDPGNAYVDINGNIIIDSEYHIDDPDDPAINNQPEVRVDAYNGLTGKEIYDFDTVKLDENDSYVEPVSAVGLARNRIYLGLQNCPGNIGILGEGSCGTTPMLYAINAPGVGIDYPRGAVLGASSRTPLRSPRRLLLIRGRQPAVYQPGLPPQLQRLARPPGRHRPARSARREPGLHRRRGRRRPHQEVPRAGTTT